MQTIDQDTGELINDGEMALIRPDETRHWLSLVREPREIKDHFDKLNAVQDYLRRQDAGLEAINQIGEARIWTAKRLGELIPATFPKGGDRKSKSHGATLILSDAGISRDQSSKWQKLTLVTDEAIEGWIEETAAKEKELTIAGAVKFVNEFMGDARRERHVKQAGLGTAIVTHASWKDWLPEQPDCDLLLTDPPYATDVDDVRAFAAAWLPAALETVKPTGRAYVCIGAYPDELAAYLAADRAHMTLAQVLVWTYRNATNRQPTHDYILNWQAILYFRGPEAPPLDAPDTVEQFAVQDINAPDARRDERYHTWQKPDSLAERLIRHSTKPGDLILDPFNGTGTFILAAARLGRIGRGCDVSPEMLATAQERGCIIE